MSYCSGSKKATVTIDGDNNTLRYLSNNPPIEVTVVPTANGVYEDYTHSMDAPIDKIFDKTITNVILNDSHNDYIYSGQYPASNPAVHRTCPIPSIQDNKIYLDFDPGSYADNLGTCTYRIFFGGFDLTITDALGQIFKKSYNEKPKYTVACDDDCPDNYCKIDCEAYPGYCCINEAEIKSLSNQLM